MKKIPPFMLCAIVSALAPQQVSAGGVYVTPRAPIMSYRADNGGPIEPFSGEKMLRFVTSSADGGPGSLRQVIASSSSGDRIRFLLKHHATIMLTNTLVIDKSLSILGPDPDELTVMRSMVTNTPSFRVFQVTTGQVVIAGMTIRNGRARSGDSFNDNLGGGIFNLGSLTVSNCVITGNVAPTEQGVNGFGGGIFTDGSLILVNCTISRNVASYAGGGIETFHGGFLFVEGCTVSGNFAGIQGGGIDFQGLAGTIENSTISDNSTPDDGAGSGLLNICFSAEGSILTVTACTIAGNSGSTNGAYQIAALQGNLGLTNRLLSTLIASNDSPNFFLDGNPVLVSLGHNLDSDGTSGLVNGPNGDQVGTMAAPIDARLSALQDNGGETFTHALLPGSPALGTGACSDADGVPLLIDQRGYPRPASTGCDIGAFENQAPVLSCPDRGHIDCQSAHGEAVQVHVADPDGDALVVVWTLNGVAVQTNRVAATHPPCATRVVLKAPLAMGTNYIMVSVSDGKAPPVSCTSTVTLMDTTPPRISSVKASPRVLTPANGQMVPVQIIVKARDECSAVSSKIIAVRSNEPVGSTPDWVITGDLTLTLRAERSSQGHGRIYTITVQVTDAAGNSSLDDATVTVPRQGGDHGDQGDDDDQGDHGHHGDHNN